MSGANATGTTVPTYGQTQQRPPPELLAFNDPIAQPPETDQTSRTSTVPWGPIQPYMVEGYAQALDQYMRPREFYPGETYVPFSQQTETGLQAQEGRAMTGNPLLSQAQGTASNVMGGAYSDPALQAGAMNEAQNILGGNYLTGDNPAFQAMADRIENTVRPKIDSQFAGAGRYGGAGHEEMMSRTMADALAPLAFQNYADERKAMQGMAKLGYDNAQQARDAALRGSILAPGLASADYTDINKLLEAGQAREGLGGRMLQSDIDRWNWQEEEPTKRLANYMSMLRGTGASGGFNTQTSTEAPGSDGNTAGSVLGGIASGVGILGDLFGKDGIFRW